MRGSAASASASHSCISARVIASSEANGSSSTSTGLPAISVRRKATRWRIPPESSAGAERSKPAEAEALEQLRPPRAAPAPRRTPRLRSASAALSIAESQGSSRSRWGM